MSGISRVQFLTDASRLGVAVAELADDELRAEFHSL